jgi:hypothetical protein
MDYLFKEAGGNSLNMALDKFCPSDILPITCSADDDDG